MDAEAKDLSVMIDQLVTRTAPQLLEQFGIGIDTTATIYRTVIVRMRFHEPTIAYVIREVFNLIKVNPRTGEIGNRQL